jgi:hypothetical protein
MREGRGIGFVFGILGALLFVLDALLDLLRGVVWAAYGRPLAGLGFLSESLLLFVVGVIIGLFAFFGVRGPRERAMTSGIVLIVLALVALLVLGGGILAILGAILALVGGIVYAVNAA